MRRSNFPACNSGGWRFELKVRQQVSAEVKSSDHSGGGEFAAVYICPMGFAPSPMAAAAAWWAAASERGVPSDATVTFSSSRRFRHAALGFRFLSGRKEKEKNKQKTWIFCRFGDVFRCVSAWTLGRQQDSIRFTLGSPATEKSPHMKLFLNAASDEGKCLFSLSIKSQTLLRISLAFLAVLKKLFVMGFED